MSPELEAKFATLFHEMAAAWRAAPEPPPLLIEGDNLKMRGEIGVVAVMHGWMARLVRSGEAALRLLRDGYGEESSPLVRSMMEHAIGLFWLIDKRGDAFQTLVRVRSEQMSRLQRAQENGWFVADESMLQAAIDQETDQTGISGDHLRSVFAQAMEYDLGSFYQGWLVETWTSHPSYASARAYYVQGDDEEAPAIELLHTPMGGHREVAAAVASALHLALYAYNKVLAGQPLTDALEEWRIRFEQLGARLVEENATEAS